MIVTVVIRNWYIIGSAIVAKIIWGVSVVFWLASAEPFWHQMLIVFGGAMITGIATIGAAWLMTRQVSKPVEAVKQDLHEHRDAIEGSKNKGDA